MEFIIMSKTDAILNALQNGEELTAAQIAARYNVAKPHNVICTLREQGYAVYLNQHTNSKGEITSKYRLGTPSRKMVAAAYAAMGSEVFSRVA
jgi:cell division septation protein DedD